MAAYQMNEVCLSGNCKFCDQQGDCVLLAIMQKVNHLESIVAKTAGKAVS
jgi:hypothetical protein